MTAADGEVSRLPVWRARIGVFDAERPGDPTRAFLLDEVDGQTVVAPRQARVGWGRRGEGSSDR
eukprot:5329572-Alexandrium_andersonii.AAC.1